MRHVEFPICRSCLNRRWIKMLWAPLLPLSTTPRRATVIGATVNFDQRCRRSIFCWSYDVMQIKYAWTSKKQERLWLRYDFDTDRWPIDDRWSPMIILACACTDANEQEKTEYRFGEVHIKLGYSWEDFRLVSIVTTMLKERYAKLLFKLQATQKWRVGFWIWMKLGVCCLLLHIWRCIVIYCSTHTSYHNCGFVRKGDCMTDYSISIRIKTQEDFNNNGSIDKSRPPLQRFM